MPVPESSGERNVPTEVETQYQTVFNLYMRRQFYDLADPPISLTDMAHGQLCLNGSETVVDVGCADARVLREFYSNYGHRGRLVGVDIHRLLFAGAKRDIQAGYPVDFIVGEAQHIPLPSSSVDTLLALFMLYHVPSPQAALAEFERVLKPGGTLLVGTSGLFNKGRHRKFERMIAAELGTTPPERFTETFDDQSAHKILPKFFTDIHHQRFSGEVHLPGASEVGQDMSQHEYAKYISSLFGMRDSFGRSISRKEWDGAVEKTVRPLILSEQAVTGHFTDDYDLHYFRSRKAAT